MNQNDQTRHHILTWFYQRNANATSARGKNGSCVKTSDVKKGLKEEYGMKPAQVVSNLTYLIDKGWVNESAIEKLFQTKKGHSIPSSTTWYQISSAGIDKIEGESEFKANHRYSGININATGQNIVTLGDGNVVHANNQKLGDELLDLKDQIAESGKLSDEEKLDAIIDIETLRDQLGKERPDKTILAHLWGRIEQVATLNDFSEAIVKISPLVTALLA